MRIEMGAFEERLATAGRRDRYPLSCLFEITPTCNLRCQFCYVALDPYKGPYLSTAQICRILDTLEGAGVLWLTFTGGEIFSRRDFPDIYGHALEKGFLVSLYTNATMVTEAIAALLAERPPFSVEVSIYGADADHYERTTQIPGSFARFERGVERLREAGVSLLMKCPITTITQDHFPELVAWCRARGLPFKADASIDARHDGGQQPILFRIQPRQANQLRDMVHLFNSGEPAPRGPLPECSVPAPRREDGREELYTCGAGRTGFFIDALGNASHCVIDRTPTFSMLETPWDEVWSRMGEWVTQPLPESAPCSGCSLRNGCSNCPARSRLATGSPFEKDPYQCETTHVLNGVPWPGRPGAPESTRRLAACAV